MREIYKYLYISGLNFGKRPAVPVPDAGGRVYPATAGLFTGASSGGQRRQERKPHRETHHTEKPRPADGV